MNPYLVTESNAVADYFIIPSPYPTSSGVKGMDKQEAEKLEEKLSKRYPIGTVFACINTDDYDPKESYKVSYKQYGQDFEVVGFGIEYSMIAQQSITGIRLNSTTTNDKIGILFVVNVETNLPNWLVEKISVL